jgi:hypothetical protein
MRHQLELHNPFMPKALWSACHQKRPYGRMAELEETPFVSGQMVQACDVRSNKGLSQDARAGRIQQPFMWRLCKEDHCYLTHVLAPPDERTF